MDDPPSRTFPRPLSFLKNLLFLPLQDTVVRYLALTQLVLLSSLVMSPHTPNWSWILAWSVATMVLGGCLFVADRILSRKKIHTRKTTLFVVTLGVILVLLMSLLLFLFLDSSFLQIFLRFFVLTIVVVGCRLFVWPPACKKNPHLQDEKTNDFPIDEKTIAGALRHIQKISITGVNAEVTKKLTSLAELTSPKKSHSLGQEIACLKTIITLTHDNPLFVMWDVDPLVNLQSSIPKRSLQYLLRQILKIPTPSKTITARVVASPHGVDFEFILKTSFKEAAPFLGDIHEVLEKISMALQRQAEKIPLSKTSRTWCSFNSDGLSAGVFIPTTPLIKE